MSEFQSPAGMPGMTRRNRHPMGGQGFSPKQMAFLSGPFRDRLKAEILAEIRAGQPVQVQPASSPADFVPAPLPVPAAGPEMVLVTRPALVADSGGAIEDDEETSVPAPAPDTYETVPGATPAMLGLINECPDPAKKKELRAIASTDEPTEVRLRKIRKALASK